MKYYTTISSSRHSSDITQVLLQHKGLMRWVVRRQWLRDLPAAEALHQGRIAVWCALQGYDPTRGYAFSTVRLSSRRSLRRDGYPTRRVARRAAGPF